MKKLIFFIVLATISITSYGQYRWEVSGGVTSSSLNIENADSNRGVGFYFNAGYGYVMGVRAKTSIVFSIELLQRNSEIVGNVFGTNITQDFKALQVGFNPKFRYLFNRGKDRFRPFINAGPAFRLNTNVKLGDVDLESEQYEQLVISGVYGVGFSQMIGEMFDIMVEVGATNDFTDNIVDVDSKFFDIYARVGVRFRIYDARR
ncbi:outer membrane beta-barrel protein [Aquimarina sp. 2201CG14-23]|uniref:outer membrane beta-barrel protein n=1 Tax=Aquimarina mycalae TaxID=3040073 RepID=UPI002477FEC1|nr:outer membrane beta-barrel protein [Aquimarina sp. 2201CG14-23]MDH7445806.1 outer membrane beta-barrel protein [Aquimarina sp. 2201CG14-23]